MNDSTDTLRQYRTGGEEQIEALTWQVKQLTLVIRTAARMARIRGEGPLQSYLEQRLDTIQKGRQP